MTVVSLVVYFYIVLFTNVIKVLSCFVPSMHFRLRYFSLVNVPSHILSLLLGVLRLDFFMMILVEINQLRATIGCFRVCMQNISALSRNVRPLSVFFQIFRLYWFCYWFIAVSILLLPLMLTMQFIAVYSVAPELCFLPLFPHMHRSAKIVLYVSVDLFKQILLGVIVVVRYKYFHLRYVYFYIARVAFCSLNIQWLLHKTILLSGDVETNPGPDTLYFYTWNLNSITTYDFLRVSHRGL